MASLGVWRWTKFGSCMFPLRKQVGSCLRLLLHHSKNRFCMFVVFFFFWLCFLLRTIRMKVELLEYQKQGSTGIIQKQQWEEICPFHLLTWRLFLWHSCCWCAALRVRNSPIHSLFNLSRKDNWKKWSFRRTLKSDSKVYTCCYGNSILGCWLMWSGFQCSRSLALSALMKTTPSAWRSFSVQTAPTTA